MRTAGLPLGRYIACLDSQRPDDRADYSTGRQEKWRRRTVQAAGAKATRPEVRGGLGGFAGLFALRGDYREPVLAASTDGVGTKLAVAQAMDKHDTVGIDLVAMVVDDLVVCGAEPLFLQDYIAVGRTVPERVDAIVGGIADGCVLAGCALLGGETAEHPGLMAARPLRHLGDRRRRGRGRRRAGPRPGQARRRHHRDGVVRPALQRILAGPQGAAGDRPDEPRRPRRGVRPHAGRGTARAHPHLRQGLPGAGRRDPGADVLPRHRRRVGRQSGTRHPARVGRRDGPRHLDARAGVRA